MPYDKIVQDRKRGRTPKTNSKLYTARVARTLMDVLVETGRINYAEARSRMYPKASRLTNQVHGSKMMTPEVYKEFINLLSVDDDLVKNLKASDIVKSILNDLKRLDTMIDSPNTEADDLAKLSTTKTAKQKLLGQYLGIWKEDKQQAAPEADPDALFTKYQGRYGLSN